MSTTGLFRNVFLAGIGGKGSSILHVLLGHAPAGNDITLHEVFEGHVINALRCQHNISPGSQDLVDALLGQAGLPLSDLLKLCWVGHQDLQRQVQHHAQLQRMHHNTWDHAQASEVSNALKEPQTIEGITIGSGSYSCMSCSAHSATSSPETILH